jgi:CubicO group peptidase (beta-lactamase class C family)
MDVKPFTLSQLETHTPIGRRGGMLIPIRRSGLYVVLFAVLAAPAFAPNAAAARQTPPSTADSDTASLEALRAALAEVVDESPVHGVAIALVSDSGAIWSGGFGTADPGTGEPVGSGTLFRANSVSKTFVALTVMRLVEEGGLSLDTPLREAAPDVAFENAWEASEPVTVAHLLEHTSGFDELRFREYGFGPDDGGLAGALAVNPAPRESRWPPGHWMAYNNGAYAVVARIVEQARGRPFDEVVQDEVLSPLGMTASGIGLERVAPSRLARHFLDHDTEEPASPYPVIIRPAGGLITSADELAAVVAMFLRRGEPLLSSASVARMETPTTSRAARAGLAVGYGLGIYGELDRGLTWLGHAGGTPSAWARYAYQPEAGVGYVVLMNGADATTRRRLERAVRDFLVPADMSGAPSCGGGLAASVAAGPGNPSEYAGLYRPTASPSSLGEGVERLFGGRRVSVVEGCLVVGSFLGGAVDTLTALGGDRFRTEDAPDADVVFLRGGDGEVSGLVTWDPANIRSGNLVRAWAAVVWGPLVALGLSLPLLLTALGVAPVRSVVRRVRGGPSRESSWARRLPLSAAISLVAAAGILVVGVSGPDGLLALGSAGPAAVGFWAAIWAFAGLSVAALVVTAVALVRERGPGRAARAWSFAVALACTTILLFLATWGFVGLRTWAW